MLVYRCCPFSSRRARLLGGGRKAGQTSVRSPYPVLRVGEAVLFWLSSGPLAFCMLIRWPSQPALFAAPALCPKTLAGQPTTRAAGGRAKPTVSPPPAPPQPSSAVLLRPARNRRSCAHRTRPRTRPRACTVYTSALVPTRSRMLMLKHMLIGHHVRDDGGACALLRQWLCQVATARSSTERCTLEPRICIVVEDVLHIPQILKSGLRRATAGFPVAVSSLPVSSHNRHLCHFCCRALLCAFLFHSVTGSPPSSSSPTPPFPFIFPPLTRRRLARSVQNCIESPPPALPLHCCKGKEDGRPRDER